ncbi:S8 family peptidase [Parabacteroides bouchesdurhonensis]|uniref:S8 family peptidase n=1 Tax=Parabacteroides bouchesdurhonensis TaxID=1936995 RepID=UPI000E5169A3|nr:S8 family serine peptidase [Parabacteroides bouchesdurhonensis]RHJ91784.1 hypothetical protein DW095_09780 [Bacteroides sp. AM07-16]
MKRILVLLVLALVSINTKAQEFKSYYLENGQKVDLQLIDTLVYFETIPQANVSQFTNLNTSLSAIAPSIYLINKKNKKDLLKNNSAISFYSDVYSYSDGTIQIPTKNIFVSVKQNESLENILADLSIQYKIITPVNGLENTFSVELINEDAFDCCNLLFESGYVNYAEPDFIRIFEPNTVPDYFSQQWGMQNSDNGINAQKAWTYTKGNADIKIAVLDEGVDLNHADLKTNLLSGYDAVTDNIAGSNGAPKGNDAHGTNCAGIIAALDNNFGVVGVAPKCKIIPIRIAYKNDATGKWKSTDSWNVNGFDQAVSRGADVISCSWGGGSESSTLSNKITSLATSGRNGKGCVIVVSSGNDNVATVSYPARHSYVLGVGASSTNAKRASFSNYGTDLDVVAPGEYIYTTDISGNLGYNNTAGEYGDYNSNFNGTSAACPFVSGIAALMLSINPTLSSYDVRFLIQESAQKVSDYSYAIVSGKSAGTWNNEMGFGLVDAHNAVISAILKKNDISIVGADAICNDDAVTYSLSNGVPASATVNWQTSSNIMIISGQGTSQVRIGSSSSFEQGDATITAIVGAHKITKTIHVGFSEITRIDGPRNVSQSAIVDYMAYPIVDASEADYEWTVTPSTSVSQNITRFQNKISFGAYGQYRVSCRFVNSTSACGDQLIPTSIDVLVGSSFFMSNANGIITITHNSSNQINGKNASQSFIYEVYNQGSGILVANGNLPASDNMTLNLTYLPKGIYVLKIYISNDKYETFKIVL